MAGGPAWYLASNATGNSADSNASSGWHRDVLWTYSFDRDHAGKLLGRLVPRMNYKRDAEVLSDAFFSSRHNSKHHNDIETGYPWYSFKDFDQMEFKKTTRVPVMTNSLVQKASRTVLAELDSDQLPQTWDQVALHFSLTKPPGDLEFDYWDRVGSFGLRVGPKPGPGYKVHSVHGSSAKAKWTMMS